METRNLRLSCRQGWTPPGGSRGGSFLPLPALGGSRHRRCHRTKGPGCRLPGEGRAPLRFGVPRQATPAPWVSPRGRSERWSFPRSPGESPRPPLRRPSPGPTSQNLLRVTSPGGPRAPSLAATAGTLASVCPAAGPGLEGCAAPRLRFLARAGRRRRRGLRAQPSCEGRREASPPLGRAHGLDGAPLRGRLTAGSAAAPVRQEPWIH